jgi:hypothetical protein
MPLGAHLSLMMDTPGKASSAFSASSSLTSLSNSKLMDSAWARMTGTRIQVAVMATSLVPQIFLVSLTIFISSSL